MTSKIALSLAACLTLGASHVALAASVASSTDEARATAGANLPPECPPASSARPSSSTDEARALAASSVPAAPPNGSSDRAPETVSDTDDSRASVAAAIDETPRLHACAP